MESHKENSDTIGRELIGIASRRRACGTSAARIEYSMGDSAGNFLVIIYLRAKRACDIVNISIKIGDV